MTAAYNNQDLIIEEELIEDFLNLDEEENKLIGYIRDEFVNYTFFNYGKIIYIQQETDINSFPHISELLENYEKIYSTPCFLGFLVIKQRKYYMRLNDGFLIIADDCIESELIMFKIKNILICCNLLKSNNHSGTFNFKLLKLLKRVGVI